MQRLTFGSITVDAVSDGVLSCALTGMLPGADPADFRRLGGCDDGETLLLPMLTFVIGSVGKTILVDTGIGPTIGSLGRAGYGGTVGLLPQGLARTGIDPATVDAVVFTHLHADHIGWNVTDRNGELVPTFPNAEYIVSKSEWAFWSATQSRDIARCVRSIEERGQLRSVEDGFEPAPGVQMIATPGHTPGHASILVTADGSGCVIVGDAAHHPAEFEDPTLQPPYDSDPAMARETRLGLAERVEAEGLLVAGGHFPAPHVGTLVRVEGKRRWRWLGAG
ncbi:MBL fold metallo-hydrolase [Candidatus Amarobacter glycogenicus]|uniref:MBL fold metallo-hydrolase n=1 Tax=Candidatus Amarobacter glycogenicus TaxID=3140699 RepID=UPI002A14E5B0|nr:MBL fold metallo-hydrolase [Dehalococcoidia bacterium]MBK9609981.1 MBL fold metallo-hydrolase [Dehalococcoidia bacterium]